MGYYYQIFNIERQPTESFCEKGVLGNFRPEACIFIKKETLVHVFSCEICEISKNTFLHKTPLVAASQYCTAHMEKIYKYYEIAASEDPYRMRSYTVAQNNCY